MHLRRVGSVLTSKKTQPTTITEDQSVNAVYGNNRCLQWEPYETENTLSGFNGKLLIVKSGGTYSSH
jgi:hypothetical protein